MDLKIGKKIFEVDRIIYISPNGSDNNNGLSKNTPLLTLKYAIDYIVNLGGGAICFMEGIHDFTDQCVYQGNYSNNYFIRDFINESNPVPIIFYSNNPSNTEIHLIKTYIKGFNRTQFIGFANKNSKLINLNIFFKCDVAKYDEYDGIFTSGATGVLITNCIFNIDVKNWSSVPMYVSSHGGTCNFDNCVFNTGETIKKLSSSCTYNNCVFQTNNVDGAKNNCLIESNLNNLTLQEIVDLKDNNENPIGIANSDYSMWCKQIQKILLQKILSSNLNNINLDKETFNLLFTDNNELYINNNSNELVKIIHSPHSNIDILNKLSIDDSKNLLYNNKKVQYKDILTIEDIMNIKYEVIGANPYKTICELANIDYSSYNSINEIMSIKENREKIINSEKAIEYLFNSNDKYFVDSFISNSDMFYLIANNETSMTLLCNSEIARNSIYDNYLITENIIANSNIAMSTMMNSSRFEKVSHSMTTEFSNLYDNKAFVFGISQEWHNGSTRVINTHGHYLSVDGNYISEQSSSYSDRGSDGLKYRVNKFADYVCQKNSYGNGSICHATIFKI